MPVATAETAPDAAAPPPGDGAATTSVEAERAAVCAALKGTPYMGVDDAGFMHGRGYAGPATRPTATWRSSQKPRADHDAPRWLTATEFEDAPDVARAKAARLAALLRLSRKTVLYTGAGISASVIGQAARSGANTVGWTGVKMEAQPTFTHRALAALGAAGLVQSWQQQNHDGLPQKAGFPQHMINEVHGSWFDPSNPVVKYSGDLKDDEYARLLEDMEDADLVLVLGTSLGGLSADEVVDMCCRRTRHGVSLGAACINMQQTSTDGKMTLRMFGKTDDYLALVLDELGIEAAPAPPEPRRRPPPQLRVLVPYGADGRRLPEDSTARWMLLDLGRGARVRLAAGHNCRGSGQPAYAHIGAKRDVKLKGGRVRVAGPRSAGSSLGYDAASGSVRLSIEGATMRLGAWWLAEAAAGRVPVIPVVNCAPSFHDRGWTPPPMAADRAGARERAPTRGQGPKKRPSAGGKRGTGLPALAPKAAGRR